MIHCVMWVDNAVGLLYVQVRELQTELIVEQKKSEDYQKGVRRYERRVKELTYQVWLLCLIQILLMAVSQICPNSFYLWFLSQKKTERLCWGCRIWSRSFRPKSRATRDKLRMLWVFVSDVFFLECQTTDFSKEYCWTQLLSLCLSTRRSR